MLTKNPPDGITAGPVSEDDLLHWEAMIQGPEGTPFEGGVFPAELKFPADYPLAPPTMKFLGEIWHPNSTCGPVKTPSPRPRLPVSVLEDAHMLTRLPPSLPKRPSVHLHPPPGRRRPQPL